MWVVVVADSQTRSKPVKKTNHPENRLFRPEFHLSFSQIGWVGKHILERSSKKNDIFGRLPLQGYIFLARQQNLQTYKLTGTYFS